MAVRKSSLVMTSNEERIAMANAAVAASSETSTPDYHLPWTGPVVEETLRKMMDFDPSTAGGVIALKSTAEAPANLDTVLDPGSYIANYVTATGLPEDAQGVTPTTMTVFSKDGILYQVIDALGNKWARFSKDNGASWSVWSPKSTNSGDIDTSGDGSTPQEDPMEDITNQVNIFKTKGVTVGTTEQAAAMLAGKYDWDTGEVVDEETP